MWKTPEDLHAAAERSKNLGATMTGDVRWIRTYVLVEPSGQLGSLCIHEATGPDAIREHARAAELPVTEVLAVADTVVVNADPG